MTKKPPKKNFDWSKEKWAIDLLDRILNEKNKRRQSYLAFVDSIQEMPAHEKAHAWLSHVAEFSYQGSETEDFAAQEALIYLQSRGHDCSTQIDKLISKWKSDAREQQEYSSKYSSHDVKTGRSISKVNKRIAQATSVKHLSHVELGDFWPRLTYQAETLDATMLRTVEWFEINGFDDWWERLAKYHTEAFIQSGVDHALVASYWFFDMCRSDLALSLMRRGLQRLLESIEIPPHSELQFPWMNFDIRTTKGRNPRAEIVQIDYVGYAAAIIFGSNRLRVDLDLSLIHEATEMLAKSQHEDGAWGTLTESTAPNVRVTTMAIHALAFARPKGWERICKRAGDWLWSVQNSEEGCWRENGADSVFLTVLVLDAIELAANGTQITIPNANLVAKKSHKPMPRFKVALSFPGEVRNKVEPIAKSLAKRLGKANVFYDEYYQADLARLDLDIYLQSIYHDQAELVVVFLCSAYDRKEWPGLEWRAIRDLIKTRQGEHIMFFRTDDAKVKGVYSIDGFIDLRQYSPEEAAKLICQRVEP